MWASPSPWSAFVLYRPRDTCTPIPSRCLSVGVTLEASVGRLLENRLYPLSTPSFMREVETLLPLLSLSLSLLSQPRRVWQHMASTGTGSSRPRGHHHAPPATSPPLGGPACSVGGKAASSGEWAMIVAHRPHRSLAIDAFLLDL
jgi:hypothetical protein